MTPNSTDSISSEPLIAAIQAGDVESLGFLFDLSSPLVYGIALAILRVPADAEEVVSNVFQEVWRNAAKFDASRG